MHFFVCFPWWGCAGNWRLLLRPPFLSVSLLQFLLKKEFPEMSIDKPRRCIESVGGKVAALSPGKYGTSSQRWSKICGIKCVSLVSNGSVGNVLCLWQHIDKMFKHKELQQQLMDTKLQRITEMMKEVEEKQQKERDLVSASSLPPFKAGAVPPVWRPLVFSAADRRHRVETEVRADEGAGDPVKAASKSGRLSVGGNGVDPESIRTTASFRSSSSSSRSTWTSSKSFRAPWPKATRSSPLSDRRWRR